MPAGFENRTRDPNTRLWVGKYRNLQNLPHWHWDYELITCRGGHAQLLLDGAPLLLESGTAAFCPSGSIHSIRADAEATLIVAQIDPKLLEPLGGEIHLAQPVFPDRSQLYDRMDSIFSELQQNRPYYAHRAEAMMLLVCIDILRDQPRCPAPATLRGSAGDYRALLSDIDRDFASMTFHEAAARMHLSKGYFSRYFKQLCGMTFSDYLNLVRVDKAIELLRSDPSLPMSEVALRCGFHTLRSFNRVFREITGSSPKQLPAGYTLQLRQYAAGGTVFDPTLSESVPL